MKNYDEMASDVLKKAEKVLYRRRKIRNIVTISVGALCLCLLICVAALLPRDQTGSGDGEQGGNGDIMLQQPTDDPPDNELPIQPTVPTGPVCSMDGITLLASISSEDPGTPMEADLTLPLNY